MTPPAKTQPTRSELLATAQKPATEDAWVLLKELARKASEGKPRSAASWKAEVAAMDPAEPARTLFDLYAPLCVGQGADRMVVAHLGQSLDGRIATECGVSKFITGPENLAHSHRMRALFDAVLVGARTVEADDPQLTTRHVSGKSPTRVILDPRRRLSADRRVFQDGASPTVILCAASSAKRAEVHGQAEVIPIPDQGGALGCDAIIDALSRRGLRRLFIEGGGVTVSRFLAAGALDRLHVAVAPMILGSGRPALSLPPIDNLADAISVTCRHFPTGRDILFDCELPRSPA